MPTKKTTTTNENVIKLNWNEFKITEQLPTDMLQKDYQWIPYLEVSIYREITRQMELIKELRFDSITTIASWTITKKIKGKYKEVKQMTLSQDCFIETKDWKKYQGNGIITASEWALLNDSSSFGVISRLKARAFKDALKYEARIFELPTEKGEENILDDFIEEWNKTETVNNKSDDKIKKEEKEEQVNKVDKLIEMITEKEPKTKEEFQKVQSLFVKQYKWDWFTETEKKQLWDIKKDYLATLEK